MLSSRSSRILHLTRQKRVFVPTASRQCLDASQNAARCNYRAISTSQVLYSGHNKWSKIRHNKAIQDSKKNVLYSRLAKDILIAATVGGSADPTTNLQLATMIKRVKSLGLPKANLERALAKAAGSGEATGQEIVYEIMTSDRIGVLAAFVTDNPARAKQSINKIVKENEARFTPTAYLFNKKAVVCVSVPKAEAAQKMELLWDLAIELGAEDIQELTEDEPSSAETNNEVEIEIIAPPDSLSNVTKTLSQPPHSFKITESEFQWRPADPESAKAGAEEMSEESRKALSNLVEELEENPECVGVWCSID